MPDPSTPIAKLENVTLLKYAGLILTGVEALDEVALGEAPFLSIGIIARNAMKDGMLENCIKSVRARCPERTEIVVVETMGSDGGVGKDGSTLDAAMLLADTVATYSGPRGNWNPDMAWFDDAAAARNVTMALSRGRWYGWIDADDIWLEPAEAERVLKLNGRFKVGSEGKTLSVDRELGDDKAPLEKPAYLIDMLALGEQRDVFWWWAPYLYQRDENWVAKTWQDRERFCRLRGNDGELLDIFHWQRGEHEVIVPKNPLKKPTAGYMGGALWVHEKKFSKEDYEYSLNRHWEGLLKLDAEGRATALDYVPYLANYAMFKAPERRYEFLQKAYSLSGTAVDRSRALTRIGEWDMEQGFHMDAIEHFEGAARLAPKLPDPCFAAGAAYEQAEMYDVAADWYIRGSEIPYGDPNTEVNPRDHLLKFPFKAANCLCKLALGALHQGEVKAAKGYLGKAIQLADRVANNDAIGPDLEEARNMLARYKNFYDGIDAIEAMKFLFSYLRNNDETEKALALTRCVPWTMEEHPETLTFEKFARRMEAHLHDEKAYLDYYDDQEETGALPTKEEHLEKMIVEKRVEFAARRIGRLGPTPRILEIGSYDGMVALQILKILPPGASLVAVETFDKARERFQARLDARLIENPERVTILSGHQSADGELWLAEADGGTTPGPITDNEFDAVVYMELIEHVPDPVLAIEGALAHLKPGGRLYISTPCGAFDNGDIRDYLTGAPAAPKGDEIRGHVRSLTARDLNDIVEEAGGVVTEMEISHHWVGQNVYCEVRQRSGAPAAATQLQAVNAQHATPVAFAVYGALWDWNASTLAKVGMGASEECLAYLARGLAKERRASVYGPMPRTIDVDPDCEVREEVGYWPRELIRKVRATPDATLVVSRAPGYAGALNDVYGLEKHRKVLWLQDTVYNDLNPENAQLYSHIVAVSQWHKKFLAETHGISGSNIVVIPNFLLKEHFALSKETRALVKREPHHFIYASSPDRGLSQLLRLWPKILELWPDATLDVFYGWRGMKKLNLTHAEWNLAYRRARNTWLELGHQKGIRDRGMVPHHILALEMMRSSFWLYPTGFAETDCNTARKMRAAGVVPICPAWAGLEESPVGDASLWQKIPKWEGEMTAEYEKVCLDALLAGAAVSDEQRERQAEEAIEKESLEARLPLWRAIL